MSRVAAASRYRYWIISTGIPSGSFRKNIRVGRPNRPGAADAGPAAALFYLYDQVDFLLGAWLVVWLWVPPTLPLVLWSVLFVAVVHQVVSLAGAGLGMRASAR